MIFPMKPPSRECSACAPDAPFSEPQFPFLQTGTQTVSLPAGLLGLVETTTLSLGGRAQGVLGPGSQLPDP